MSISFYNSFGNAIVALEAMATNLLLIEWMVKLQQQLSQQQRLIEEQQQTIEGMTIQGKLAMDLGSRTKSSLKETLSDSLSDNKYLQQPLSS